MKIRRMPNRKDLTIVCDGEPLTAKFGKINLGFALSLVEGIMEDWHGCSPEIQTLCVAVSQAAFALENVGVISLQECLDLAEVDLEERHARGENSAIRKLNPADPSDAELIQEHKDAIRHGQGIVFDLDKKEKPQ